MTTGGMMLVKAGRHLLGSLVACMTFAVQSVVVYAGLLAYAVIADTDAGGPLAAPFLMLLAVAVGVVLVPILFLPASLVGETAAKEGRLRTKWLASTAVAVVLALAYVFLAGMATGADVAHSLLAGLIGTLTVLVPTALCVSVPHGALKLLPGRLRVAHS